MCSGGARFMARRRGSAAAADTAAAPEPTPAPEPAYVPSPYGPRVTVTQGPSAGMPNAGGQATDELQVSAAMAKRSKGSYRTAGVSGLNIPGAA